MAPSADIQEGDVLVTSGLDGTYPPGLAVARAGTKVNAIGRAVDREVRRRGFRGVRGLAGHGVGRKIHEEPSVPNHYDPWQADVLTDGMVITIEPMLSAGSATRGPMPLAQK